MDPKPTGRRPVAGIADIQALAVAAVTALEAADLAAEALMIHTRVLSRPPEQLLEQVTTSGQTVWTFTPIVELLMHELSYLATSPAFSPEERRERIRWTVDVAGF